MHVKHIAIEGFRGIQRLNLDFNEQINVLLGVNGAGKTAVLDAVAVLLSRLMARIRNQGTGRSLHEHDVHNQADSAVLSIVTELMESDLTWTVAKERQNIWRQTKNRQHRKVNPALSLKKVAELIQRTRGKAEAVDLPIIAYYPVNRAILDIPLRVRKKHSFDQLAAYDEALSGKGSAFRVFFEWFRNREDLENERRIDEPKYRDHQLETVRIAISRLMPGFKELRVRRNPLRMTLAKDGVQLLVNQLSDGEKCFLALAGDLARRLALANVTRKDPLQGNGVILIDEIDLHLHPEWQRRAIPGLLETFPNCQFIVSTHSAQVVSHVPPEGIWMLHRNEGGKIEVQQPQRAFGMDSNSILEDIMHATARPAAIETALADIFLQIQKGDTRTAQAGISKLMKAIGQDPELMRADALIRRKKLVGK